MATKMATKIDWDNISACSGRDSRFPVIKLGLAGNEKGPFRRINLGNEYEDIVAAMRSRAIELLTEGDKDLVSSLESFKVTLKYQDTDGEECIIMSSDEVHDAVAQYEGCSSIKVFATVEKKKPTAGKEMRVPNKLEVLQSASIDVASVIESREDMAENRSHRGEAKEAESREGVDTSSPRKEKRRPKKMPPAVPRMTAATAKYNIASLQKQPQSPRQLPSTYSDRSSIHAIHTGNISSPPKTISTKTVGRYPKKSQKDSSDRSFSSRSSGRRWSPPSLSLDDSYESNRSSKSALFLQKAPAKVIHVPSENCKDKVKSLRLQKIDGKNKKLIKLDAAPRSFMVTAHKKIVKPSAPPVTTKDEVPCTLDIAANISSHPSRSAIFSSFTHAETSLAKKEAAAPAASTTTTTTNTPHRSITPVNWTTGMPPRRPRQAAEIANVLQAQKTSMSSISSRIETPEQLGSKLQLQQQDLCTPTPSEARTEKIRNVPYGTTTTTTSETKRQQQQRPPSTTRIDKKKNDFNVEVILAMNSSGRSGFFSGGGGGDKESLARTKEEDGDCSSYGSRTSTTSEADTYEGEETCSGSSTYNNNVAGSGRKAEAFSLNSILAGFYSFSF